MKTENQKYVVITVDINDGDYITEINKISPEQLEAVNAVASAIKKFEPYEGKETFAGYKHECRHNFPIDEMCREDLGEIDAKQYYVEKKQLITSDQYQIFLNLCPFSEYGFHTVDGVKVLAVIGEIDLI